MKLFFAFWADYASRFGFLMLLEPFKNRYRKANFWPVFGTESVGVLFGFRSGLVRENDPKKVSCRTSPEPLPKEARTEGCRTALPIAQNKASEHNDRTRNSLPEQPLWHKKEGDFQTPESRNAYKPRSFSKDGG
ncbi:hypothetical protein GGR22_000864 [Flavobacterium gossypii]|uniref:Uncharacterized protein n=1 Tax=Flavobacterium gossypii TaxID=1646119 RepID=A0ABR6DM37_9FLAO|nr:hypothetical protein [Flavobacterium gossypii]MBA9072738.1 hypothetical protein [Flavobacterium gossypii]